MPLRHWPASIVRRLWAAGLCAELAVVAGTCAVGRATAPPADPGLRAFGARMDRVDRGQLPPPPEATPAQRALLAGVLRDSLGITWQRRGGVTEVRLPPPMAETAGRAVEGLVAQTVRALLLGAALFLPIPLALVMVTGVWAVARRRERRAGAVAPGV